MGLVNDEDSKEEATDALVLMVVGLDVRWKLPISHFFIKGLSGEEKLGNIDANI